MISLSAVQEGQQPLFQTVESKVQPKDDKCVFSVFQKKTSEMQKECDFKRFKSDNSNSPITHAAGTVEMQHDELVAKYGAYFSRSIEEILAPDE